VDAAAKGGHIVNQPQHVQAALDRLADHLGAIDVFGRLPLQRVALDLMTASEGRPDWQEIWHALYDLCLAIDDEQTGEPNTPQGDGAR
jgi:hypothetical protein